MTSPKWHEARQVLPDFVIDGKLINNIPVVIRRANGKEEQTVYQGFGNFGYSPDYITDVTHWKSASVDHNL